MPGAPVSVRIIRPRGKAKGVVLDIHGGGWVIGNAQMNDDMNIAIVDACSVTVVSVDYRLAVSTPVEGLMEDCLSAARWLLSDSCEEFAGLPVIVVGESAGGHLAAATLLALKRWPNLLKRVRGTVLYYGVYDLTGTASVRTTPPEALVLDGPGMVEAFRMLTPDLTDQERQQPPLSPLYGDFEGCLRHLCLPVNWTLSETTLSKSLLGGTPQRLSRCTCYLIARTGSFTSRRGWPPAFLLTVGRGYRVDLVKRLTDMNANLECPMEHDVGDSKIY